MRKRSRRAASTASEQWGETVDVSSLTIDPENVRKHGERNLNAIRESLRRFGQQKPIVVDADGIVIAGNGALEAARELRWKTIRIVRSHLDGSERTAYAIADNRTAELAEWEGDDLLDQLTTFAQEDAALLEAVGFTSNEVAKMVAEANAGASDGIEEDDVPEPPRKATTKKGDVWRMGDHVLVCGDTLDVSVQQLALAGQTPKMVFSDPPYNVGYGTQNWDGMGLEATRSRAIANDNLSPEEWNKFCVGVARLFAHVTDGCVYVCHAPGPDGRVMAQALDAAMHWSGTIIWAKNQMVFGRAAYQRQYEAIWFGWPHKHKRTFTESRRNTDLWHFDKPHRNEDHPTIKPLGLVARAVEHASAEGDLVFDPFAGSGTTLIACEKLGRRCSTIELDPIYCDVIVKRWKNLTDKTAKRDKRTRKRK